MKKTLLILLAILSLCTTANSQVALLGTGKLSRESAEKTFWTQNDVSVRVRIESAKEILVKTYDKSGEKIAEERIQLQDVAENKIRYTRIRGIYEIGGYINIFIDQLLNKKPQLIRISIDPATGKMTEQKTMFSFPEEHTANGEYYDKIFFRGMDVFYVVDDPSAGYIIIVCEGYNLFEGKSIEINHYTERHEASRNIKINAFDFGYDYVKYWGGSFDKENNFIVASYVFNKQKEKILKSQINFSKWGSGQSNLVHQSLPSSYNCTKSTVNFEYNPDSNLFDLSTLTLTHTETTNKVIGLNKITEYYLPITVTLDPKSMVIVQKLSDAQKNVSKDAMMRLE